MAQTEKVQVPDIGDFDTVDVIEVLVSPGDTVAVDDPLITLESDKASMEVPSPVAGTVREITVSAGDQVASGDVIAHVEVEGDGEEDGGSEGSESTEEEAGAEGSDDEPAEGEGDPKGSEGEGGDRSDDAADDQPIEEAEDGSGEASSGSDREMADRQAATRDRQGETGGGLGEIDEEAFARAHASPSVRRFARELGADLGQIRGTGRKGRIVQEDVQAWVKEQLEDRSAGQRRGQGSVGPTGNGLQVAPAPKVDHEKYGPVSVEPLSRIQQLTGKNLHRSWVTIPHVTQFDEADVTDLEDFRKAHKDEAKAKGVGLTPLPFLVKACVGALKAHPWFNTSLAEGGEQVVFKEYIHIGIAVDTPKGLVVPVIKDADRKGLLELAADIQDLAERARERKLKPEDLEGGTFTISSLGNIGGTAFTPIINPPQVAILGVSRMETKPVWDGSQFVPRKVLPFSLSYDHRVIDGVAGARFTGTVARNLEDLRRLLL